MFTQWPEWSILMLVCSSLVIRNRSKYKSTILGHLKHWVLTYYKHMHKYVYCFPLMFNYTLYVWGNGKTCLAYCGSSLWIMSETSLLTTRLKSAWIFLRKGWHIIVAICSFSCIVIPYSCRVGWGWGVMGMGVRNDAEVKYDMHTTVLLQLVRLVCNNNKQITGY